MIRSMVKIIVTFTKRVKVMFTTSSHTYALNKSGIST
jgi:hypothetical protein